MTADAQTLRARLRADLAAAMKERRREAVTALRTALAAVDDAEAVDPAAQPPPATSEHVAGAHAGLGAAEVRRRELTADDVRAILRTQVAERRAEAGRYDAHGRHDAADRLRREADVLGSYLGP
ncbi:GatB/YqeY domain-containing protein [Jiangella endophytica]|uniref:GatB/YqeY domain-containing protein n=1 Tax=Jiangella endophytica TaxID=1623398 RepID=UPI000E350DD4|nr:GatB/YqeY domain-containing protein [Jiangella endophytica]